MEEMPIPHVEECDAICTAIAEAFDITLADIKGRSRIPRYILPRYFAMHYIYEELPLTQSQIAAYFGAKEHSVVTHGIRRAQDMLAYAEKMANEPNPFPVVGMKTIQIPDFGMREKRKKKKAEPPPQRKTIEASEKMQRRRQDVEFYMVKMLGKKPRATGQKETA